MFRKKVEGLKARLSTDLSRGGLPPQVVAFFRTKSAQQEDQKKWYTPNKTKPPAICFINTGNRIQRGIILKIDFFEMAVT